jgi:CBS domain containing-hemolysin-like protein
VQIRTIVADYVPGLIWLIVLLLVNAFFVAAEFAVISARRSQIEPPAEEGNRGARTTLWAMEHATLMLATSQLGITVCSLLILNVSEPAIHHLLEIPLAATGLTDSAISVIAFVVALVLVTFLHVVFGEMVPKNLSFSVPGPAALLLAPPLVMISRVFKPVIWLLNWLANSVLRLFGIEPKGEATSTYSLDEVAGIVEQSTREGLIDDTTGALAAAFEFTTKKVSDIEVPIADVVALAADATPNDLQRAVVAAGHSRYGIHDAAEEPTGTCTSKTSSKSSSAKSKTPQNPQPTPEPPASPLQAPGLSEDAGSDLVDDHLAGIRRGHVMAKAFRAASASPSRPAPEPGGSSPDRRSATRPRRPARRPSG